jgi:predicted transglutaminase-like cysteine proteinase
MVNPIFIAQDGVFVNKRKLMDVGMSTAKISFEVVGITEKGKHILVVENSAGFWEIANTKCELLGVIYYWKKWKEYVWEQQQSMIMSVDCLEEIVKFITELNTKKEVSHGK